MAQTRHWVPTIQQAVYLQGFSRNSEYYIEHIAQIREQYAGKFIAILDSNVMRSDNDGRNLLNFLKKQLSQPEYTQVYVTYVPTETEIRIK